MRLVVLNKFGRLEAAGKGLRRAFDAALEAGIPVLTSVSPSAAKACESYAASGFITLQVDIAEVDAWIRVVLPNVVPTAAAGAWEGGRAG